MRFRRAPVLVLVTLALAVACRDSTVMGPGPVPRPQDDVSGTAGLMAITISGIGTPTPTATAEALPTGDVSPAGVVRGNRAPPLRTPSSVRTLSRLSGNGQIQLDPVSTSSFTLGTRANGGSRYVSATFRVRNAHPDGTAYTDDRTNLTFIAAAPTSGSLAGTPFLSIRKFDGNNADPSIAPLIVPTGWSYLDGTAHITTVSAGAFQAYTETELPANPANISLQPYGFVVQKVAGGPDRTLPANPAADQFDGMVTFAFKVPLQPTAATDPFTIIAQVLAVDDDQVWLTQTLEETDGASVAALAARAGTLSGAQLRSLASASVGGFSAEPVCSVRTAGTAASPLHVLNGTASIVTGFNPAPFLGSSSFLPASNQFSASFCQPMQSASASTFVITGSQTGRHFVGAGYSGGGTGTLTSPSGTFFPGEVIEAVASTGLLTTGGAHLSAASVARYRVATSAATAVVTRRASNPLPNLGNPEAVVSADFNNDGKLDLAVANLSVDNVNVLLADGAGNFSPAPAGPSPVGLVPFAITSGDFNEDGIPDVAVANLGSNNVSILLGTGSGGFTPAPGSPMDVGTSLSNPRSIAAGLIDNDSHLDLAVANSFDGTVSVLRGDGTGAFTESTVSIGSTPQALTLADVTNDGHPDLVVLTYTSTNNLRVFVNDGAGAFTLSAASPMTIGDAAPIALTVADVNHDGWGDLAVITEFPSLHVLIQTNTATQAFSEGPGSPMAVTDDIPFAITAGDVNADGKPDLLTGGPLSSGGAYALLGDGAGGFSAAPASNVGSSLYASAVVVASLDGDTHLDLVGVNSGGVMFFPGDGTGAFTSPGYAGTQPKVVALGDVDNDGKLDIISANAGGSLSVLMGNGAGGYTLGTPVSLSGSPVAVAVADVNGDGNLDLLSVNSPGSSLTVHVGNGSGGFTAGPGPFALAGNANGMDVGDVNGDGNTDVVVSLTGTGVRTMFGNGAGGFTDAGVAGPTSARRVRLADVNHDGRLDLVALGSTGLVAYRGNGAGGFAAASSVAAGSLPTTLALGDVNGDGNVDALVGDFYAQDLRVMLGDGVGGFAQHSQINLGTGRIQSMAAGDLDGDGHLDLGVVRWDDPDGAPEGVLDIMLGNGSGDFTRIANGPIAAPQANSIVLGDFTGDGKLDVVTPNTEANTISVFVNH